jgi:peptide/nickel transport system permease protein
MYLLRRLLQTIVVLWLLSVGLFFLFHLMPGRAEDEILAQNPSLTAAEVERIRTLRGLDRPIAARYACWVIGRNSGGCDWWPSEGLVFGDLGWSSVHHLPVSRVIAERLPNTLRIMLPALLFGLLLAIPLGVTAARNKDRIADRAIAAFTFVGTAAPVHWVALLSILVFAVELGWLPTGGVNRIGDPSLGSMLRHLVLPVGVSAIFFAGRWARHLRSAMLEVLSQDFVDTARAKGISERAVVGRHALRNALLPLITEVTQALPPLFSGTLVIERIFSYPGIGLLIFESLEQDDHLVAVVVVLISAAVTMAAMLVADLAYYAADPRIRSSSEP